MVQLLKCTDMAGVGCDEVRAVYEASGDSAGMSETKSALRYLGSKASHCKCGRWLGVLTKP
jgi:hypothetical protein